MILTLQFSSCLVERVEVTVEVPAEGQSPPLHRVSPTLIPQVHLFNENNQKVGDVSYSNPVQFVLVCFEMYICANGSKNAANFFICTFALIALTLSSVL